MSDLPPGPVRVQLTSGLTEAVDPLAVELYGNDGSDTATPGALRKVLASRIAAASVEAAEAAVAGQVDQVTADAAAVEATRIAVEADQQAVAADKQAAETARLQAEVSRDNALEAADAALAQRLLADADAADADAARHLAQVARDDAQAAADSTTNAVVNFAVRRTTLAELTTAMSASDDGDLGEVYGLNSDEGVYRSDGAGGLVRISDTQRQIEARVEATGVTYRTDVTDAAMLAHDPAGNIVDKLSLDGRTHTIGPVRHSADSDDVLRIENWQTGAGLDILPDGSQRPDQVAAAPAGIQVVADDAGFIGIIERPSGILDTWRYPSFNLARPSLVRSRRGMNRTLDDLSNETVHTTWVVEDGFDLVRLVYENDSADPVVISGAVVAPTAVTNTGGGHQPLDGAGNAVAWTPVTFDGAGADLPLRSAAGSVLTCTIPGITGEQIKSYAFSDWMPMPSIAPTDGGLPLVMTRTYCAGDARGQRWQGLQDAIGTPYGCGRFARGMRVAGDNTAGALGTVLGSGWWVPGVLQYYARGLGATVLAIGDSITMGTGSVGGVTSWGHLACAQLSRPGRPVSFANSGWGGQTSLNFWRRARQEIDLFRPSVVCIATFSPNDGPPTQASCDASLSRALDVADYAYRAGVVPILVTPIPLVSLDSTEDGYRQSISTRLRAMAASGGMLVLDADAAVTDGATPARIRAACDADGTHINDAGNRAVGRPLLPLLSRALGI